MAEFIDHGMVFKKRGSKFDYPQKSLKNRCHAIGVKSPNLLVFRRFSVEIPLNMKIFSRKMLEKDKKHHFRHVWNDTHAYITKFQNLR